MKKEKWEGPSSVYYGRGIQQAFVFIYGQVPALIMEINKVVDFAHSSCIVFRVGGRLFSGLEPTYNVRCIYDSVCVLCNIHLYISKNWWSHFQCLVIEQVPRQTKVKGVMVISIDWTLLNCFEWVTNTLNLFDDWLALLCDYFSTLTSKPSMHCCQHPPTIFSFSLSSALAIYTSYFILASIGKFAVISPARGLLS